MNQIDAVFRALSDATRRIIIDELAARDGQTLFELCVRLIEHHRLGISRQAISKHLAILEEADLVRTGWQGRTKLHRLNLTPIERVSGQWLRRYTRQGRG